MAYNNIFKTETMYITGYVEADILSIFMSCT